MSQSAFAALAGASKGSQIAWEKPGGPSPSAADLECFAGAGADVLYIVTNRRSAVGAPPIDANVLRQVIEGVEEVLAATKRKADPAKKAEAIVLLYEHFQLAGRVERGFIERQLRLVA